MRRDKDSDIIHYGFRRSEVFNTDITIRPPHTYDAKTDSQGRPYLIS